MRRRSLTQQAARVTNYLIETHGMTATQIAAVLGVHKSFVSRCKNAEREFGPGQIEKLADHLNMPPGAMLLAMLPEKPPHADPRINEARRLCREVILMCDRFTEAVKEEQAKKAAEPKAAEPKAAEPKAALKQSA